MTDGQGEASRAVGRTGELRLTRTRKTGADCSGATPSPLSPVLTTERQRLISTRRKRTTTSYRTTRYSTVRQKPPSPCALLHDGAQACDGRVGDTRGRAVLERAGKATRAGNCTNHACRRSRKLLQRHSRCCGTGRLTLSRGTYLFVLHDTSLTVHRRRTIHGQKKNKN